MITDEEIQASVDMHISENEDGDCMLEPFAFARAIYQLGRQHQRESDAALCEEYQKKSYLSIAKELAGYIRSNTGELK